VAIFAAATGGATEDSSWPKNPQGYPQVRSGVCRGLETRRLGPGGEESEMCTSVTSRTLPPRYGYPTSKLKSLIIEVIFDIEDVNFDNIVLNFDIEVTKNYFIAVHCIRRSEL
jgi:hypothetical protein